MNYSSIQNFKTPHVHVVLRQFSFQINRGPHLAFCLEHQNGGFQKSVGLQWKIPIYKWMMSGATPKKYGNPHLHCFHHQKNKKWRYKQNPKFSVLTPTGPTKTPLPGPSVCHAGLDARGAALKPSGADPGRTPRPDVELTMGTLRSWTSGWILVIVVDMYVAYYIHIFKFEYVHLDI